MHVRDFFADGDLIRQMQAEIRALSDGNAELREKLARSHAKHDAACLELESLRDELRRSRGQGEALVTVKKVWDALDRLEHDLGAARGAIAQSKRSIGQAFEKAELLRN